MNFISVDFHLHYLTSYTLYIHSDFINNYLVVLSEENEVLVYLHYDNSQPTAEVVKFLSYPFTKVIIGMPHQDLVWVPADVFDVSEKSLYAPYFLDDNLDNIFVNQLEDLDVVALYQFDQVLYLRWKLIFPEAKFVPIFDVFMQQAQKAIPTGGETIGVHIYDNQADLFLFVNNEFKLYNSFEVATPDDLSYFLISILKNFSLIGTVDRILVSGVEEGSDWVERLQKYTEELVFLEPKTVWTSTNSEVKHALSSLNILADTGLCV